MNKFTKFIKKPTIIINYLMAIGFFNFLSDKAYIKLKYYMVFRKKLNLKDPKTFNEKLQWLKLYDRNPLYTSLVDKIQVKEYISKVLGKEYIIPTIATFDSFEEINFDNLPNQFVIKTTHDSGTCVICKEKKTFDTEAAKQLISKRNYYLVHREWPYKNVKKVIIAEKYLADGSNKPLQDYKFFCFDGEVKAMFIASDRGPNTTKFDFFDENFNKLPIQQHYPNSDYDFIKPANFDRMKELASQLSKGFPHVRVDSYDINGSIYFGEMTFYHFGGFEKFEPKHWDKTFGDWIDLSKAYNYNKHQKKDSIVCTT